MDNCNYKISKTLLMTFLADEQKAADFYQQLMEKLTDNRQKAIIGKIRDDEIKHFIMLTELYKRLYRCCPDVSIAAAELPDSVEAALSLSIEDELTAYEEYRDTYLSNCDNAVRKTFFELFTDEGEHASWEIYLLHLNKK